MTAMLTIYFEILTRFHFYKCFNLILKQKLKFFLNLLLAPGIGDFVAYKFRRELISFCFVLGTIRKYKRNKGNGAKGAEDF